MSDGIGSQVEQSITFSDYLFSALVDYAQDQEIPAQVLLIGAIMFVARLHTEALTEETVRDPSVWDGVLQTVNEAFAYETRALLEEAHRALVQQ